MSADPLSGRLFRCATICTYLAVAHGTGGRGKQIDPSQPPHCILFELAMINSEDGCESLFVRLGGLSTEGAIENCFVFKDEDRIPGPDIARQARFLLVMGR